MSSPLSPSEQTNASGTTDTDYPSLPSALPALGSLPFIGQVTHTPLPHELLQEFDSICATKPGGEGEGEGEEEKRRGRGRGRRRRGGGGGGEGKGRGGGGRRKGRGREGKESLKMEGRNVLSVVVLVILL